MPFMLPNSMVIEPWVSVEVVSEPDSENPIRLPVTSNKTNVSARTKSFNVQVLLPVASEKASTEGVLPLSTVIKPINGDVSDIP